MFFTALSLLILPWVIKSLESLLEFPVFICLFLGKFRIQRDI